MNLQRETLNLVLVILTETSPLNHYATSSRNTNLRKQSQILEIKCTFRLIASSKPDNYTMKQKLECIIKEFRL